MADQVATGLILSKNTRIQGTYLGSVAHVRDMNAAIALHRLQPVVDRVFDFEDAPAALAHLESGRHFGKIAIAVG